LENVTVNKFWALVFGVVLAACGGSFFIAPAMGWWLPEGVSAHAGKVDFLWDVILWITGFFFFLTEAILVAFLFLYCTTGTPKPPRASGWPAALKPLQGVLHDSHRVEMAWTVIPAIILLYIAFAQIDTWAEVKYQSRAPEFGTKDKEGKYVVPLKVDVSARQFEWRIRYPHPDRLRKWLDPTSAANQAVRADFNSFERVPQADDVHDVNELHLWRDNPIVVSLTTRDVIHSFNIPIMRVKQDALPGKVIPVWFKATKANTAFDEKTNQWVDRRRFEGGKAVEDRNYRWDIPCAELCGWGHYRMIGRVYVHETADDFLRWLVDAEKAAHARSGSR
jgi:cytochrome c oxidase subunit 2